jgi:sister-chromatid-cohesion protein PDS5
MAAIQRKASLWIVNTSSIPPLVKRIQRASVHGDDAAGPSEAERFARAAKTVLAYVSKHCPALYKLHTGELAKALADEKNPRLGEVALQALAAGRWDASDRCVVWCLLEYVRG